MHPHWTSGEWITSYSHRLKRIWSFPIFSGRGSCICQTWKGSPRGEFWSFEDGQNIIIHPMYSINNVEARLLDVWGPDQVLQPSPQAHLIISHFSGRGSCICQTWKGSPWGKFWSSEDGQIIIIHPMYSFNNVDALYWMSGCRVTFYSHRFKRIGSFPVIWEGELHLSNLERVSPRWVLVLWWRSKYHNSSNVII